MCHQYKYSSLSRYGISIYLYTTSTVCVVEELVGIHTYVAHNNMHHSAGMYLEGVPLGKAFVRVVGWTYYTLVQNFNPPTALCRLVNKSQKGYFTQLSTSHKKVFLL